MMAIKKISCTFKTLGIILCLHGTMAFAKAPTKVSHSEIMVQMPRSFLASKMPYEPMQNPKTYTPPPQGCTAFFINHVGRHGSRHLVSQKSYVSLLHEIAQARAMKGLGPKADTVETWLKEVAGGETNNLGMLTEQGKKELRDIAARMYQNFPSVFLYNNKSLVTKSTYQERAQESRVEFTKALIKAGLDEKRIKTKAAFKQCADPLLRFFEVCRDHVEYVDKDPAKSAIAQFDAHPDTQKVFRLVLNRIFTNDYIDRALGNPSQIGDMVKNIYELCGLEAMMDKDNVSNKFCGLLKVADVKARLEFRDDLFDYFNQGPFSGLGQPGSDVGERFKAFKYSCPLLRDFLDTTKNALDPHSKYAAQLRFAHAETILPFVTLLGLYDLKEISGQPVFGIERDWHTAIASPLAANVQWIVYKCKTGSHVVRMLQNEREISFPLDGCRDRVYCPWNKVNQFYIKRLQDFGLNDCNEQNWAKACNNEGQQNKCSIHQQ